MALAVVLAASLAVLAPAASQEEQEAGINGFVTGVSGATVLIEEDPLEDSGSDKASAKITPETEISRRQGQNRVPAAPEDLEAGQLVEATFSGPVAESYPVQATAGSIAILEDADDGATDAPGFDELPGTGGTILVALGVGAFLGTSFWRRVGSPVIASSEKVESSRETRDLPTRS